MLADCMNLWPGSWSSSRLRGPSIYLHLNALWNWRLPTRALDARWVPKRTQAMTTPRQRILVGLGMTATRKTVSEKRGGGHSPFTPDPRRNRPKPSPISNENGGTAAIAQGTARFTGPRARGDGPRQTPDLERKHKEELKHNHYASHCQMCLCERPPQELAPVGSYIETEEVRQSIVDAHHADLVSVGGVRHAGNLILLCKLHHENYGRQFTRVGVTAALRDSPARVSICFGKDSHVRWPANRIRDLRHRGSREALLYRSPHRVLVVAGDSIRLMQEGDWSVAGSHPFDFL